MSEPWLIGEQSRENMKGQMMPGNRNDQNQMGYVNKESNKNQENGNHATDKNPNSQNQNLNQGNFQPGNEFGGGGPQGERQQNTFMEIIRGLHEGHIGGLDLHNFIDITAVSLIILTITGIILSIKVLKAQAKRNRR
ncbi:MAG: PepSY-associated TM helix domain-containing protein [Thermoactinomyces sp.]